MGPVLVIKKYPNRRLYDTEESRYITVDELTVRIRKGRDVRVVDARTEEDLTQSTLVQVLLEGGRTHLLPTPLLTQLVRMGDDALAEFFGRWMTWALEVYFAVRQQAQSSWNPMAQVPFNMGNALARMFLGGGASPMQPPMAPMGTSMGGPMSPMPPMTTPMPPAVAPMPTPAPPAASESDLAALRRELDELKGALKKQRAPKRRR